MVAPLLRRGYTVLAVSHLSQPQATVMEIVEDVNRAMRFIRYHADEYGIDPNRLGVTGGSAGGYTVLCALAFTDVFLAGASYYGIGDLEGDLGECHIFGVGDHRHLPALPIRGSADLAALVLLRGGDARGGGDE